MPLSCCVKVADAIMTNGRLRVRDTRIVYCNAFFCSVFFFVWIIVGYSLDSGIWDDPLWHHDMLGQPGTKSRKVNGTVALVERTTDNRKTSFCENKGGSLNKDGFLAEPANALSNYGFCVYGFVTVACGMQDFVDAKKSRPFKHVLDDVPWWSFLLGVSQMVMGIGSFLYHAGITRLGQTLDVAGIYIILFNLMMCMLARFFHYVERWGKTCVVAIHVVLVGIALISNILFCLYKWRMSSVLGMIGLISCLVVLVFAHRVVTRRSIYLPFVAGAIGTLGLGYLAWIGDKLRWWCDYTSFFQGHACWHVLVATSYFCGYLIVRSEGLQEEAEEAKHDDLSVGIEISPKP